MEGREFGRLWPRKLPPAGFVPHRSASRARLLLCPLLPYQSLGCVAKTEDWGRLELRAWYNTYYAYEGSIYYCDYYLDRQEVPRSGWNEGRLSAEPHHRKVQVRAQHAAKRIAEE